MSEMFYGCESLKSLPDITKWICKWDFKIIENIRQFCFNCKELCSLPNGFKELEFGKCYKEKAFDGTKIKVPKNFKHFGFI